MSVARVEVIPRTAMVGLVPANHHPRGQLPAFAVSVKKIVDGKSPARTAKVVWPPWRMQRPRASLPGALETVPSPGTNRGAAQMEVAAAVAVLTAAYAAASASTRRS